jgi:hypothetical protein
MGAVATILGFVAADFFGGKVVAIFGSSLGLHPEHGEDIGLAFDVLGGDLESVDDQSCAARVAAATFAQDDSVEGLRVAT